MRDFIISSQIKCLKYYLYSDSLKLKHLFFYLIKVDKNFPINMENGCVLFFISYLSNFENRLRFLYRTFTIIVT